MTKRELAQLIVDRLNDAMLYDPEAMHKLCETRVSCNQALIDHPTIQVLVDDDKPPAVGMIGILNGLVGTRDNGWGYIAGTYDDETGQLLEFQVLDEAAVKPHG